MLILIYKLVALQIYAKDCHYNFSGIVFKPLHEWMDEISAPLNDWIDEIKETYLLKNNLSVPRGVQINEKAADFVPSVLGDDNTEMLKNLHRIISMIISELNNKTEDVEMGTSDLLGRIGAHLQKHLGLLNLALKEKQNENNM